jgi:glucosyl-dolichyl phosphate glucuronosyltransferase
MIKMSVLICTYNRADYLSGAIESCLNQTLAPDQYEIVVADNNSTDSTRELVNTCMQKYQNIRYMFEPVQGLNITRTSAAKSAYGKYIAYLDDDARADKTWVESLLNVFENKAPNPVCVGGKIFLDWEGPRPDWYPEEFDSLHAYMDHGNQGFYLKADTSGHYLIGTNMAFLRQIVIDMGGFRTHCGRLKRRTISGAETEMINRVIRAGFPVYYCPEAIVKHIVVPERRTKKFLINRVKGDGATQPLLDLDRKEFRDVNIYRRILYDAKLMAKYFIKSVGYYLLNNKKKGFVQFLNAVQKWGRTEMEMKFLYNKEFSPLWKQRRSRFSD